MPFMMPGVVILENRALTTGRLSSAVTDRCGPWPVRNAENSISISIAPVLRAFTLTDHLRGAPLGLSVRVPNIV